MKKLLTILFVSFMLVSLSYAQMQLGVKAGLNLANLSGDDIENTDARTGFAGGVFFMYQFSEMFAIQPEVYYTMKGATQKDVFPGVDAEGKLDYVEIPVLLKLIIPVKGSSVKPAIFAGPSLAFNLSAKLKLEDATTSVEEDWEDVKSTDFGLVFGAGLGFAVGNGELGVDVRYILGLTTVDDSIYELDMKNGVINFNLYYGFCLK